MAKILEDYRGRKVEAAASLIKHEEKEGVISFIKTYKGPFADLTDSGTFYSGIKSEGLFVGTWKIRNPSGRNGFFYLADFKERSSEIERELGNLMIQKSARNLRAMLTKKQAEFPFTPVI